MLSSRTRARPARAGATPIERDGTTSFIAGQGDSTISLRVRLPLLISALLLAMVGASIGAAYVEVRRSATSSAADRLERLITQLAQILSASTGQLRARTTELGRNPVFQAALRAPRPSVVDSALTVLRSVAGSSVIAVELWDSTGARTLTTDPSVRRATPDEVSALMRMVSSSEVVAATGPFSLHEDMLSLRTISKLGGGTAAGYLVNWAHMVETPAARRQLSNLVGSDARILLGNRAGDLWSDLVGQVAAPPVSLDSMARVVTYTRPGVGPVLAAARPISGTPAALVIEFPQAGILAPARETLGRLSLIAGVVLIIGSLGAWAVSRSLTTPLVDLASAATAISDGDFGRRVRVGAASELGVLERSFNRMAEAVATGRQELQAHARALEDRAATLASVSAELDAALDGAPVGFAFHDLDLRYRRVNGRLAELHGASISAHVGMRVTDVLPELGPTIESHMRRVLETGAGVYSVELQAASADAPDGVRHWLASYYPVRTSAGALIGVGSVMMDMTGYKLLERQLLHAQKMEAVGRLAGGVAHDFNNILTAISNFTQFAINDLPPNSASHADLEQVQYAAARAVTLTKQLLAFSRQQVLQPQVLNLNEIVLNIAPMLRRIIGEHIELRSELVPDVWPVRADPGQIEQVILNLVVNARDAMPNGGQLQLGTSMAWLTEEYVREGHPGATVGPHVVLSVADSGEGMDAATQTRIFEPFFSTKAPGRGTGLGLAMVYGVVRQSGGSIWVYSEPGHGTAFKIYLPRFSGAGQATTPDESPPLAPLPSAVILLVEDEPQVRMVARRTLEQLGHTVIEATDGRSALEIVEATHAPIDLVITDLIMPGMGGRDLVSTLRARGHTPRVLFMSGYAMDTVNRQLLVETSEPFLEKPFTRDSLTRKVHEVLSRS